MKQYILLLSFIITCTSSYAQNNHLPTNDSLFNAIIRSKNKTALINPNIKKYGKIDTSAVKISNSQTNIDNMPIKKIDSINIEKMPTSKATNATVYNMPISSGKSGILNGKKYKLLDNNAIVLDSLDNIIKAKP